MATRIHTIEYAWPTDVASKASATRVDFTTITIHIPETSPVFRSVYLYCSAGDNFTTATSQTAVLLGIKLGAVAVSDNTVTDTITNSGESQSYIFSRDVTSYFTTNWTGTSMTAQASLTVTGGAYMNCCMKIIITYEFSDASTTWAKTVRIPIETSAAALTTSLTEVGTNQIPNLSTFLPENTVSIKNIWFELSGSDSTPTVSANSALGIQVGANTEVTSGAWDRAGMDSACYFWLIFNWMYLDSGGSAAGPNYATNAAYSFKIRAVTASSSTYRHPAIIMYVTYTYNHTNSTTVMNSLILPVGPFISMPGSTAAGDESVVASDFWVEEANVSLKQSGVLVTYAQSSNVSPVIGFGSQTMRTYTDANVLCCGSDSLTQRVDSGSGQGAGFTLARGVNTIKMLVRIGTAGITPNGFDGLLYLNYTSDKHASGEGVHNHTCIFGVMDYAADALTRTIASAQKVWIPESGYVLNAVAGESIAIVTAPAAVTTGVWGEFTAEATTGETLAADGWPYLAAGLFIPEGENGVFIQRADCSLAFDRSGYNSVIAPGMAITTARRWRYTSNTSNWVQCFLYVTTHSVPFTVAGNLVGYTGNGSGVTVNIHDSSTGCIIATATTASGGGYTATVYDNTRTYIARAQQDTTHVGSSAAVTPA